MKWGVDRSTGLFHVIGASAIGGTLCDSRLAVIACAGMPRVEECCEECFRKVTRWAGDEAEQLNVPRPGQASTMFRIDLKKAPEKVGMGGRSKGVSR